VEEARYGLPTYLEVCRAHRRLGDLAARVGAQKAAEDAYRTALAVFTKLATPIPGSAEYAESRLELAACHNSLGGALIVTGQVPEAVEHFQLAIDLLAKPPASNPGSIERRAELARGYHGFAKALRAQRERGPAQENYRRALDVQNKLVADFPEIPRYRLDLAEIKSGIDDLNARVK
jgi:tetratricopeptide (TPR) repeat protein